MEFELRVQEFISLIRKDKYTEAVKYARKNLAKFADENMEKFKMIMGMLAFSKDKIETIERYKELLQNDKWDWLINMFIKESYHLHSLTTNPLLIKCLNIGVSILKTLFCTDEDFFNENCPTCSKSFHSFGSNLPFIHKTNTSLL